MENFFDEVEKIVSILKAEKKDDFVRQINNARIIGGTVGEKFDIICSLLKTYEISNPELFNLVKTPAKELYKYAENLGLEPLANFDIFEELK